MAPACDRCRRLGTSHTDHCRHEALAYGNLLRAALSFSRDSRIELGDERLAAAMIEPQQSSMR